MLSYLISMTLPMVPIMPVFLLVLDVSTSTFICEIHWSPEDVGALNIILCIYVYKDGK